MAEISPPDLSEQTAIIERTPEAFWNTNNWGRKAGIPFNNFKYLWEASEGQYDENFEAHNFDHGLDAFQLGNELADEYEAAGSQEGPVDRKALVAATLLHDAGKYDDFLESDFETQEEFAAEVARPILYLSGYTPEEIETACSVIVSTAEDAVLKTPTEKIMGMADLHNIGEEESNFRERTKDFLAEAKRTQGEAFDRLMFKIGTLLILGANLKKDLTLSGISQEWRQRAITNYEAMIEEYAQEEPECLPRALRAAGGAALAALLPEGLYQKMKNSDEPPTLELPADSSSIN